MRPHCHSGPSLCVRSPLSAESPQLSTRAKRSARVQYSANDENIDPQNNIGREEQYDDSTGSTEETLRKPAQVSPLRRYPSCQQTSYPEGTLSPRRLTDQDHSIQSTEGRQPNRPCSSELKLCAENAHVIQLPTPKTPRHREALSKTVPITPRHRIGLVRRNLLSGAPRTPQSPSNAPPVYRRACQLFTRSAEPGRLVGRDDERTQLRTFLKESISSRSGRCIYVSGPPGTGKSALVSEVCQLIQVVDNVHSAHINCMSMKSADQIYTALLASFVEESETEHDPMSELKSLFMSKRESMIPNAIYLVTLDEIDHLMSVDLEALYTLFEWSLHPSSRLIVIGIANALDLTDRLLPRLKSRNLKPDKVPFLPYTAPQITSIIVSKLRSLLDGHVPDHADFVPLMQPGAVQLCSKKVASQTGDLRKAFDIIRRTIDLVGNETSSKEQAAMLLAAEQTSPSKRPLSENPNLASASKRRAPQRPEVEELTPLTAPRANIAHVSRISAAAFGNGASQRLKTLNLQQKAALCALISHQRQSRMATASIFASPSKPKIAPTVKELHETYRSLCKREDALQALTATEFADVLSGLDGLGLVGEEPGTRGLKKGGTQIKRSKGEAQRLLSFVDARDMETCLGGAGGDILRGLLLSDD